LLSNCGTRFNELCGGELNVLKSFEFIKLTIVLSIAEIFLSFGCTDNNNNCCCCCTVFKFVVDNWRLLLLG
jgi:hypothetical protein